MILAAGRGERMRPLTDHLPKPLVEVRGKPLIVHHIEKLVAVGVERIVINVSYRAEDIRNALGDGGRFGCELKYSYEPEPLESGGGVATAAAFFNQPNLILVSADIFSEIDYAQFLDYRPSKIGESDWSSDAHFFLVPRSEDRPGGEFALGRDGRCHEGEPRQTLANVGLLRTALIADWPQNQRFALLPHYRDWVARGRVTGQLHTGLWCNVTTPGDVDTLNRL